MGRRGRGRGGQREGARGERGRRGWTRSTAWDPHGGGWVHGGEGARGPSWHQHGAYVAATRAGGRRKKGEAEMDGGRRPSSPKPCATDLVFGEHTGVTMESRGSDPTARIRRREVGDDESRRRTPAARKGGKSTGAMGVRFGGVGASPVFKGCIPGIGWGRGVPRRAGDERRPPGSDGNGSGAMPGGGGAWGGIHARSGGLPSHYAS
uniref:Collagen-like protein n=1 Tax=Oryza sativa subsp. japonica TaxID=39947 RepID=Q6ZAF4_ORYSJ|nr:collagen-like protein [Oryza sativa Japonica Group]